MRSTQEYSPASDADIKRAAELLRRELQDARFVLVGIGAGFSASAGLNYMDEDFFRRHFPAHAATGLHSAWEAVVRYWDIMPGKECEYWGYWAGHIRTMRFDPPCLPPYVALADLIRDKEWFIISTNADGQVEKMGLDPSRIFTPQGDYALFQCSLPCREEVWDNRRQVLNMIEHMPDPLHIREEDVPRCPHCGRVAVPNLRKDDTFVDALYHKGYPYYRAFLERALGNPGELLLLELGVGFNTPGIIRRPFEQFAERACARLIRLNLTEAGIPEKLEGRGMGFAVDAAAVLREI